MTVVGVAILVVNRVGRDVVFLHQRRGNIVLSRERVRRAAEYFSAAGLERAQQVGGFAGDMQAGAEALALEWQLLEKTLANTPQNRHLALGPFDSFETRRRQTEIVDVIFLHGVRARAGLRHGFSFGCSRWHTGRFSRVYC